MSLSTDVGVTSAKRLLTTSVTTSGRGDRGTPPSTEVSTFTGGPSLVEGPWWTTQVPLAEVRDTSSLSVTEVTRGCG